MHTYAFGRGQEVSRVSAASTSHTTPLAQPVNVGAATRSVDALQLSLHALVCLQHDDRGPVPGAGCTPEQACDHVHPAAQPRPSVWNQGMPACCPVCCRLAGLYVRAAELQLKSSTDCCGRHFLLPTSRLAPMPCSFACRLALFARCWPSRGCPCACRQGCRVVQRGAGTARSSRWRSSTW